MLRLLALLAQTGLLLLIAYNAITALWGWRNRSPAPPGARSRWLRVVIPAHNEQSVIGTILEDLKAADYRRTEIWVLADRCDDSTVELSREAGVHVVERSSGPPGKGAVLAWHLAEHPLARDETLVVFDADNRVPTDALRRIADELDAGHEVVQCYLDVSNPGSSALSDAAAMSYWAGNRMIQLARSNLGWSSDLGGTGIALTADALEAVGGFSDSLTEDQELGARLVLAGKRVEWLHDVRVQDEKPGDAAIVVRQRARWMAGKRQVRAKHLVNLVRLSTATSLDLAVRLVQPGRSFVALASGVLAVTAAASGSTWLLPWEVWGLATAVQVLQPIPFLARDGLGARRLVRYPLLVLLAALWVPIRLLSSRVTGWYHTPHRGSSP